MTNAEFGIRNAELRATSPSLRAAHSTSRPRPLGQRPAIAGSAAPVDQTGKQQGPRGLDAQNRRKVGEFVGNVFYGTLIKEMQASKMKGTIMRGGRGEEVFGGQLAMELAKRMGQSANNPLADRIYHAILKHTGKLTATGAGTATDDKSGALPVRGAASAVQAKGHS